MGLSDIWNRISRRGGLKVGRPRLSIEMVFGVSVRYKLSPDEDEYRFTEKEFKFPRDEGVLNKMEAYSFARTEAVEEQIVDLYFASDFPRCVKGLAAEYRFEARGSKSGSLAQTWIAFPSAVDKLLGRYFERPARGRQWFERDWTGEDLRIGPSSFLTIESGEIAVRARREYAEGELSADDFDGLRELWRRIQTSKKSLCYRLADGTVRGVGI
ncbi:MAG: hypothetical protein ACUVXI_05085 [bacterium]